MAKKSKIQVSTVRQMADVQVININAAFVTKAVKARLLLEDTIEKCTYHLCDQYGNECEEDTYANATIPFLNEHILPFLQELTDALEGKEEDEQFSLFPFLR